MVQKWAQKYFDFFVQFCPNLSISSILVHFFPILSIYSILSISSNFVYFIQFCPFYPILSILSNFVHFIQFCPFCSSFCPFVQFCSFLSILSFLVHSNQFCSFFHFIFGQKMDFATVCMMFKLSRYDMDNKSPTFGWRSMFWFHPLTNKHQLTIHFLA